MQVLLSLRPTEDGLDEWRKAQRMYELQNTNKKSQSRYSILSNGGTVAGSNIDVHDCQSPDKKEIKNERETHTVYLQNLESDQDYSFEKSKKKRVRPSSKLSQSKKNVSESRQKNASTPLQSSTERLKNKDERAISPIQGDGSQRVLNIEIQADQQLQTKDGMHLFEYGDITHIMDHMFGPEVQQQTKQKVTYHGEVEPKTPERYNNSDPFQGNPDSEVAKKYRAGDKANNHLRELYVGNTCLVVNNEFQLRQFLSETAHLDLDNYDVKEAKNRQMKRINGELQWVHKEPDEPFVHSGVISDTQSASDIQQQQLESQNISSQMSPKSGVSRVYEQIEKIEEEIYEDEEFQTGVLRLPAEPIIGKRYSQTPDDQEMRISKEILYNYHHPLVHEFQPKAYKSKDELKDLIQVIKGTISNDGGDQDIQMGTVTIHEEVTNEKGDSSNAYATKRTSKNRTSRLQKSKKSTFSKSNKSRLSQLNRNQSEKQLEPRDNYLKTRNPNLTSRSTSRGGPKTKSRALSSMTGTTGQPRIAVSSSQQQLKPEDKQLYNQQRQEILLKIHQEKALYRNYSSIDEQQAPLEKEKRMPFSFRDLSLYKRGLAKQRLKEKEEAKRREHDYSELNERSRCKILNEDVPPGEDEYEEVKMRTFTNLKTSTSRRRIVSAQQKRGFDSVMQRNEGQAQNQTTLQQREQRQSQMEDQEPDYLQDIPDDNTTTIRDTNQQAEMQEDSAAPRQTGANPTRTGSTSLTTKYDQRIKSKYNNSILSTNKSNSINKSIRTLKPKKSKTKRQALNIIENNNSPPQDIQELQEIQEGLNDLADWKRQNDIGSPSSLVPLTTQHQDANIFPNRKFLSERDQNSNPFSVTTSPSNRYHFPKHTNQIKKPSLNKLQVSRQRLPSRTTKSYMTAQVPSRPDTASTFSKKKLLPINGGSFGYPKVSGPMLSNFRQSKKTRDWLKQNGNVYTQSKLSGSLKGKTNELGSGKKKSSKGLSIEVQEEKMKAFQDDLQKNFIQDNSYYLQGLMSQKEKEQFYLAKEQQEELEVDQYGRVVNPQYTDYKEFNNQFGTKIASNKVLAASSGFNRPINLSCLIKDSLTRQQTLPFVTNNTSNVTRKSHENVAPIQQKVRKSPQLRAKDISMSHTNLTRPQSYFDETKRVYEKGTGLSVFNLKEQKGTKNKNKSSRANINNFSNRPLSAAVNTQTAGSSNLNLKSRFISNADQHEPRSYVDLQNPINAPTSDCISNEWQIQHPNQYITINYNQPTISNNNTYYSGRTDGNSNQIDPSRINAISKSEFDNVNSHIRDVINQGQEEHQQMLLQKLDQQQYQGVDMEGTLPQEIKMLEDDQAQNYAQREDVRQLSPQYDFIKKGQDHYSNSSPIQVNIASGGMNNSKPKIEDFKTQDYEQIHSPSATFNSFSNKPGSQSKSPPKSRPMQSREQLNKTQPFKKVNAFAKDSALRQPKFLATSDANSNKILNSSKRQIRHKKSNSVGLKKNNGANMTKQMLRNQNLLHINSSTDAPILNKDIKAQEDPERKFDYEGSNEFDTIQKQLDQDIKQSDKVKNEQQLNEIEEYQDMQDEVLVGTQRPIYSNKKKSTDELHNVEENKLYVPQITETSHKIIQEATAIQTQIQQEVISQKDDQVKEIIQAPVSVDRKMATSRQSEILQIQQQQKDIIDFSHLKNLPQPDFTLNQETKYSPQFENNPHILAINSNEDTVGNLQSYIKSPKSNNSLENGSPPKVQSQKEPFNVTQTNQRIDPNSPVSSGLVSAHFPNVPAQISSNPNVKTSPQIKHPIKKPRAVEPVNKVLKPKKVIQQQINKRQGPQNSAFLSFGDKSTLKNQADKEVNNSRDRISIKSKQSQSSAQNQAIMKELEVLKDKVLQLRDERIKEADELIKQKRDFLEQYQHILPEQEREKLLQQIHEESKKKTINI